jgi:signal transduction histidine kinase
LALFRIIQETLNNVEKHSKATEVKLTLRREDSSICVTIIDNGKGFDPDELVRKKEVAGLGLVGMKERASFFEGTVSIDSTRDQGTEVSVRIPLKDIR